MLLATILDLYMNSNGISSYPNEKLSLFSKLLGFPDSLPIG